MRVQLLAAIKRGQLLEVYSLLTENTGAFYDLLETSPVQILNPLTEKFGIGILNKIIDWTDHTDIHHRTLALALNNLSKETTAPLKKCELLKKAINFLVRIKNKDDDDYRDIAFFSAKTARFAIEPEDNIRFLTLSIIARQVIKKKNDGDRTQLCATIVYLLASANEQGRAEGGLVSAYALDNKEINITESVLRKTFVENFANLEIIEENDLTVNRRYIPQDITDENIFCVFYSLCNPLTDLHGELFDIAYQTFSPMEEEELIPFLERFYSCSQAVRALPLTLANDPICEDLAGLFALIKQCMKHDCLPNQPLRDELQRNELFNAKLNEPIPSFVTRACVASLSTFFKEINLDAAHVEEFDELPHLDEMYIASKPGPTY